MSTRKILVLAANPLGTTRLQLDEELKAIREAIRRSTQRDSFDVQMQEATTLRDLYLALLEFQPHIVHFSGHGAGKEGLQFTSDIGTVYFQEQQQADGSWKVADSQYEKVQNVDAGTVADLLKLFADQVECVVLNACDSNHQGAAIARHIPYVISMRTAINDRAAQKFSEAFYDGLGAGRDYEFSFKLGKTAIQAEISDPTDLIAILKKGPALSSPPMQSDKPEKILSSATQRKIERLKRNLDIEQQQSDDLTEVIQVIVREIEENRQNSLLQRSLNKKKKRHEEEREEYDLKIEKLQTEIERLIDAQ